MGVNAKNLAIGGFARFERMDPCFGDGAGDGTRTRDIQLGRLELYQLSYSRSFDDGGGGRIRTSEGFADRFTVCSLWPLGNPSTIPQPFVLPGLHGTRPTLP